MMAELICRWKPFWIPTGDTFQEAYLEEWQLIDDESKCDPGEDNLQTSPKPTESAKLRSGSNDVTFKQEKPWDTSSAPKSSWQAVGETDAPTWKVSGTQGTSAFWEKSEAPLSRQKRVCNCIHPKKHSRFPERLKLPYPDGEILSGYEGDVSFIRDRFTTWMKADFNTFGTTCVRHYKDSRRIPQSIRQKTRYIFSGVYRIDKNVPNRSPVQKKTQHLQLESRTPTWKRRCI